MIRVFMAAVALSHELPEIYRDETPTRRSLGALNEFSHRDVIPTSTPCGRKCNGHSMPLRDRDRW
jgi:hypothetical protein